MPQAARWGCCLPGWDSPFGMAPAKFAHIAYSSARGSPLEPAVELQSSSWTEGMAKRDTNRIAVKARESQGSRSSLCWLVGGWSEAPLSLHTGLRGGDSQGGIAALPAPSSLFSSLFPPSVDPHVPPCLKPQSSLKISRQILLNREDFSRLLPCPPSLPLPFLACWVLCFSCYK